MHSARLEIDLAFEKKMSHVNVPLSQILCFTSFALDFKITMLFLKNDTLFDAQQCFSWKQFQISAYFMCIKVRKFIGDIDQVLSI